MKICYTSNISIVIRVRSKTKLKTWNLFPLKNIYYKISELVSFKKVPFNLRVNQNLTEEEQAQVLKLFENETYVNYSSIFNFTNGCVIFESPGRWGWPWNPKCQAHINIPQKHLLGRPGAKHADQNESENQRIVYKKPWWPKLTIPQIIQIHRFSSHDSSSTVYLFEKVRRAEQNASDKFQAYSQNWRVYKTLKSETKFSCINLTANFCFKIFPIASMDSAVKIQ